MITALRPREGTHPPGEYQPPFMGFVMIKYTYAIKYTSLNYSRIMAGINRILIKY